MYGVYVCHWACALKFVFWHTLIVAKVTVKKARISLRYTTMQDNTKTNASEEARQRRNARERAKRASETEAQ